MLGRSQRRPPEQDAEPGRERQRPRCSISLSLAPAAERYTFKNKTQLDYILVSPELQADLVAGSVKADHRGVFSGTSDHFPVIARFMID